MSTHPEPADLLPPPPPASAALGSIDNPHPATTISAILDTPGQWHLLARRDWGEAGGPIGNWDYLGADTPGLLDRKTLWDAIAAGQLFCPQRRLPHECQWLASAFTQPPPAYAIPSQPKSLFRRSI